MAQRGSVNGSDLVLRGAGGSTFITFGSHEGSRLLFERIAAGQRAVAKEMRCIDSI